MQSIDSTHTTRHAAIHCVTSDDEGKVGGPLECLLRKATSDVGSFVSIALEALSRDAGTAYKDESPYNGDYSTIHSLVPCCAG